MAQRLRGGEWATLAALTFLAVGLLALPLLHVVRQGLAQRSGPTLAPLMATLGDQGVRRALWHSLETAAGSGLFALLLGSALAAIIGLTDIRARATFTFLLILPMMIPQHVTAIAWLQATGPGSPLLQSLGLAPPVGTPNPLYSLGGILMLLTIQHVPLVFLVLLAALKQVPGELFEAARIAGARPHQALRRVLLPVVTPAVIAAYALAVVSTLGNFGIPALLGIPARYITLPVLIWRRLSSFGPSMLSDVAVLSFLLGLVAIAAVLTQMALQRRAVARLTSRTRRPIRLRLGRARAAVEGALAAYIAFTLVLPVTALLATSLVPTYGAALTRKTATLANYAEVLLHQQVTLRAFANSTLTAGGAALVLAVVAVALTGFLFGPTRRAPRALVTSIATLAEITYAIPGVVISIAFILTFLRPLPLLDLSLYNTLAIIFLAYIAAFFSIALKPVGAAIAQLDEDLDAAARVAGAGFGKRFRRVLFPLVSPAALSGAIIVFLTAYNEVTVSALLWSNGTETVGTTIFNYEDAGYTTLAAAMAMVTVLVTVGFMVLINMLARRMRLPPGALPWRL
ncbi:MAG: iron ABC transporter permease [Paracoccaceae bacterium]|nr:iron ABC transporter permease [Paracoccaceae bacterium]